MTRMRFERRSILSFAFLALALSLFTAHAEPLDINTLAGHDVPGSSNGVSSSARFRHPNGIAADAAGNIYVADTENCTIRKITPGGAVSTLAGLAGSPGSANGLVASARFNGPQGIAVDAAGNVYVADTGNATIRKIMPAGIVVTLAGAAGSPNSINGTGVNAYFNQPQAVAVDNAGNVFVADTGNHTIRKITPAGLVTTVAGLAGNSGGADGVTNKARFNQPSGIAVDATGNLYVADFGNHTIRKVSPDGTVSTIAGSAGIWGNADGTNQNARFFQPQGIVTDNAGNLFVSDSGNQVIRMISPVGTNWLVSTIAGLAGTAGSADGTNTVARFYFPSGLARDPAGSIYIADFGNNTIRTDRIVPPVLQLAKSGNQVLLSWPGAASRFTLETASSVTPGAIWSPDTNGVTLTGDFFIKTNQLQSGPAFYRLKR